MDVKGEFKKLKEDLKKDYNKTKQEIRENNKRIDNMNETEKLARTGNTLVKGCSFWFLIPVFAVIAIVLVFGFFWVWDLITG